MKNKDTLKGFLLGVAFCFAIETISSLILKIVIVLNN